LLVSFFVCHHPMTQNPMKTLFFVLVLREAGGGIAAFLTAEVTGAFGVLNGFVAGSSLSESLLLDGAGFLTGFCTGVDVNTGLTGATEGFFFVFSSGESESDDESFFFLI